MSVLETCQSALGLELGSNQSILTGILTALLSSLGGLYIINGRRSGPGVQSGLGGAAHSDRL